MTCAPRSEARRATGIWGPQLPCRWTLKWWAEPAYRKPWLAKTPGGRRLMPRGPKHGGEPAAALSLDFQRRGTCLGLGGGPGVLPTQ